MELPFEASLLIPFLVAWRAAPTSGDEGVRLAAVASTMKKYDREFDEAKAKAAAAALALRLDELDRDIDEGVRSLCPEDAACVSCGLKGTFTSSSRPTVMHLPDKPIDAKVVTTVCSACGCIHRFNECSAFEACVVLLHHKPSVVKSLQASSSFICKCTRLQVATSAPSYGPARDVMAVVDGRAHVWAAVATAFGRCHAVGVAESGH